MKKSLYLALILVTGFAFAQEQKTIQEAKAEKSAVCSAKNDARKHSLEKLKEVEATKKEINKATNSEPVAGLVKKRQELWAEINKLPGNKRGPKREERAEVIKQIDEVLAPLNQKLAQQRSEHESAKKIWRDDILPCTQAKEQLEALKNAAPK
jgi:hypothetical protein